VPTDNAPLSVAKIQVSRHHANDCPVMPAWRLNSKDHLKAFLPPDWRATSEMGQSRHFGRGRKISGLTLPHKQTFSRLVGMSQTCQMLRIGTARACTAPKVQEGSAAFAD
jgi:hypothetical protein